VLAPQAARTLGVTYHQLIGLLRFNKMPPPSRDTSGDYLWTADDLERARQTLRSARYRSPCAKEVANQR
jgi:hypothetical protein